MRQALSAFLAAGLVLGGSADAALIFVNSTADDTTMNGNCTLREAVLAANTNAAVDGCSHGDPSLDAIYIAVSGTIWLTNGPLVLTGPVNVSGPSETSLVIDGGGQRIFDIAMSNAAYDATIQLMTLRNGAGGSESGGAVRIGLSDSVSLERVIFDSNTAQEGGAVGFTGGDMCTTLSITRCLFIGNYSSSVGGAFALTKAANGGVRPFDWIEISESQFTGNRAETSAGALFANVNGDFVVDQCSFVGNEVQGGNGGAISTKGTAFAGPKLVLKNSLFAGNHASGTGGAVMVVAMGLQMVDTTMIRNSALSDSNPATIWVLSLSGAVTTSSHSVVADTLAGADCYMPAIDSLGFNLDSDGSCPFTLGTDLRSTDPQIGGPVDLGGWTLAAAPSIHSPVIDSGSPSGALDENGAVIVGDQLSQARPVDGDGSGGAICDRGSIEAPATWSGLFLDSFEEGSTAAWNAP